MKCQQPGSPLITGQVSIMSTLDITLHLYNVSEVS